MSLQPQERKEDHLYEPWLDLVAYYVLGLVPKG